MVRRAVVFAASQPDWPFAVDEGARSVSGFKKDAPVLAVLAGAYAGLVWNASPGSAEAALAWWADCSEAAWGMLITPRKQDPRVERAQETLS